MAEISARGVKYWPAPRAPSLGGLLDEPFVGVPLEVRFEAQPFMLVNEVLDQLFQLGRALDPVPGVAEDHSEDALLPGQDGERMVVLVFELRARSGRQR